MINAFIIGAMKCGTNTLYHALRQDPRIAVPERKELDYFLKTNNPSSYDSCFDMTSDTQVLLDGTTQYSKYPGMKHVPQAIHRMNRDAKIVFLLRDPIDRLESNMAHNIARRWKIGIDDWFGSDVWRQACKFNCYFQVASMYARLFGADNLYLGIFEKMVENPSKFAMDVARFIGVDAEISVPATFQKNKRRSDNQADQLSLAHFHEMDAIQYFKEDLDCLKQVFNVDYDPYWKRYREALESA